MKTASSDDDFKPLTPYEKKQVAEISKWKKEEPGVVGGAGA